MAQPDTPPARPTNRLVELDALRGIAAVLVMLFHYTTRYDQLYGHESAPAFSLPWGHYGVNLFFVISGFVIFMTLHRVKRPMDFLVSRFTRLFPAYWAAVVLTFLVTTMADLPDKSVGAATAAMNLFMIHGLAHIPHVDGVYWTLEIELLFYAMALAAYLSGRLDKMHAPLFALLGIRLIYFLMDKLAGIELSWTLSHLLILPYIAWFICGIVVYRLVTLPEDSRRLDLLVLLAATAQLAIVEGIGLGLLAASLSLALWAAAKGKLSFLANPVLAWLGTISYTLYLLHENIGWVIIMHAERAGMSANLSIALAIMSALAMATGLTWLIERPAMRFLRNLYRRHPIRPIPLRHAIAAGALLAATFAGAAQMWHSGHPATTGRDPLAGIQRADGLVEVACPDALSPRRLAVFVIGQSNAANSGERPAVVSNDRPATFYFEGKCYRSHGPAPGATGNGSSLWVPLSSALEQATGRQVVFSVLAVDSTQVRDWIAAGELSARLRETVADQREHGFVPDLVFWQQGEADAKVGTGRAKYLERFRQLVASLRTERISAPIVAALSTRCGNDGSTLVRDALVAAANGDAGIVIGPDTDELIGPMRYDGCHFSSSGQSAAAELWRDALIERKLVTAMPARLH